MTTRNAGQAELLRFTCKVIFASQMVVNLAKPAYFGVHDNPSMQAVIHSLGRPVVLSASLVTASCLLLAFWIRELRVAGGLLHATLCAIISVVSLRSGYWDTAFIWSVYAFGGAMLAATGVRRDA